MSIHLSHLIIQVTVGHFVLISPLLISFSSLRFLVIHMHLPLLLIVIFPLPVCKSLMLSCNDFRSLCDLTCSRFLVAYLILFVFNYLVEFEWRFVYYLPAFHTLFSFIVYSFIVYHFFLSRPVLPYATSLTLQIFVFTL